MRFGCQIGLVIGVGVLACGCGWNAPADGDVAVLGLPIVQGDPVGEDEHLEVVAIMVSGGMCSGTLITPDVIMTAGHCVDSINLGSYSIRFSHRSAWTPFETRGVSERLRHPQYDRDYVLNDIALLRLDAPAPDYITPVPPLPGHMPITYDDVGGPIEFAGFGEDEDGDAGVKLKFTGEIKWLCDGPDACQHSNYAFGMPHTLCFDQSEGGTCSGDSGGPAFVERDGRAYVAGITSYGDRAGCTIYGCSTKVDAFQDFIVGFTGGGLGQACAGDADCLWGNCVDGYCCNSACGDPCMRCDRSGREGFCEQVDNGTPCPDGDVCNGDEECVMGHCLPGTALDCADTNPCTEDVCSPTLGCLNDPEPDGFECGEWMMCQAGSCVEAKHGSGGCATTGRAPVTGVVLLIGLLGVLGLAVRRGS